MNFNQNVSFATQPFWFFLIKYFLVSSYRSIKGSIQRPVIAKFDGTLVKENNRFKPGTYINILISIISSSIPFIYYVLFVILYHVKIVEKLVFLIIIFII